MSWAERSSCQNWMPHVPFFRMGAEMENGMLTGIGRAPAVTPGLGCGKNNGIQEERETKTARGDCLQGKLSAGFQQAAQPSRKGCHHSLSTLFPGVGSLVIPFNACAVLPRRSI